ncbi:ABC transporter ATP-binding protein [Amycolatopsis suaedae]|uniref:ATP-binding cassette domain-containing protein n=1 Tax=Amycolatopsis suaedae TaxID=2510978 RepID=A0A4V2EMR9_9PSEU|nr:ATP-binding cassette domain-containing protein [Amycolatopsis suaedae]RZQ66065.1 ATP-binding cassette domain-containing protein [Amycolatopsis suaedae]
MPSEPVIELDSVGVDYHTATGTVTGVHSVSLAVAGEGMTVLAGPSGSGKSTLLRVAALVERPTRGSVRFAGVDTAGLRDRGLRALRRDRVGLVFQRPTDNLVDYLSVGGNLHAAARSARRDCDAEAILDRLGLAGTADWHISALSGGQQQRLAFGCALARGSTVILADEPTSQLDDASADLVLRTLTDLMDSEHAILVASHDDRLVELGDRVVRLRAGRLEGQTS